MTVVCMTPSDLVAKNYSSIRSTVEAVLNSILSKNSIPWFGEYDREAVFSDVTYKMLTSSSTFDSAKASLKTWVSRIARNAFLDYIRDHRDNERLEERNEKGDLVYENANPVKVTPEDDLVAWDLWEAIDRKMSRRSEVDRNLLELYAQGYKPKELAERFGLTADSVAVRICKSKKDIAETIAA